MHITTGYIVRVLYSLLLDFSKNSNMTLAPVEVSDYTKNIFSAVYCNEIKIVAQGENLQLEWIKFVQQEP